MEGLANSYNAYLFRKNEEVYFMPARVNGSWVSGPLVDRMTADAVPSWGRTYQS